MGLLARIKAHDLYSGSSQRSRLGRSADPLSPSESITSFRSALADESGGSQPCSPRLRQDIIPELPPPVPSKKEWAVEDIRAEQQHQQQSHEHIKSVHASPLESTNTRASTRRAGHKGTPRPKTMEQLLMRNRTDTQQRIQTSFWSEPSLDTHRCSSPFSASHDSVPRRRFGGEEHTSQNHATPTPSSPAMSATTVFGEAHSTALAWTPEKAATKSDEVKEIILSSDSIGRNKKTTEAYRNLANAQSSANPFTANEHDQLLASITTSTPSKSGHALRMAGQRLRSGLRRTSERPKTADEARSMHQQREMRQSGSNSDISSTFSTRRRKGSISSLRTAAGMGSFTFTASTSRVNVDGTNDCFTGATSLRMTSALAHRRQASTGVQDARCSYDGDVTEDSRSFSLPYVQQRRTAYAYKGVATIVEGVPPMPALSESLTQNARLAGEDCFRPLVLDERKPSITCQRGSAISSADGTSTKQWTSETNQRSEGGKENDSMYTNNDAAPYATQKSMETNKDDITLCLSLPSSAKMDPVMQDLFMQLGSAPAGLPDDDLARRSEIVCRFIKAATVTRSPQDSQRVESVQLSYRNRERADLDFAMRRLETDFAAWMRARILCSGSVAQSYSPASVFIEARRSMRLSPCSWRLNNLYDFSPGAEAAKDLVNTESSPTVAGWKMQYSLAMDVMAGLSTDNCTSQDWCSTTLRMLRPVPRSRHRHATSRSSPSSTSLSPSMLHRMELHHVGALTPWQEDMGKPSDEIGGDMTELQDDACIGQANKEEHSPTFSDGDDDTARNSPADSSSPSSFSPTIPPTTLTESVLQLYQNDAKLLHHDFMSPHGAYDENLLLQHTTKFQPLTPEAFRSRLPTHIIIPTTVSAVDKLTLPLSPTSETMLPSDIVSMQRMRALSSLTATSVQAESFHSATSSPDDSPLT